MVYELEDTEKVAHLFKDAEDSLVLSCLQREMGKVFVTDLEHPRSAMTYLAEFSAFAGEPDRALVKEKYKGFVVMVPPNAEWERLILDCFPAAERDTRYAIRKDAAFDRQKLKAIVAALPEGYELRRIDGALYEMCRADEAFEDNVVHFDSKEDFLARGRGYAVLKDGQIVSAASFYTVYREGIEIQIMTAESERRKGLASAAGAKLILSASTTGCTRAGTRRTWTRCVWRKSSAIHSVTRTPSTAWARSTTTRSRTRTGPTGRTASAGTNRTSRTFISAKSLCVTATCTAQSSTAPTAIVSCA